MIAPGFAFRRSPLASHALRSLAALVVALAANGASAADSLAAVIDAANAFMTANPPPAALTASWFGLTYINVVWQEKMVSGMLASLGSSFVVVLLMMIVLFFKLAAGLNLYYATVNIASIPQQWFVAKERLKTAAVGTRAPERKAKR